MKIVKKFVSVTMLSGMLTFLRMLSGFIVSKVIAVYAGPSGLALLGQAQNLAAAFNGIVSAPLGNALIRYTAEHHERGFETCSPWWRSSIYWSCGLFIPLSIIILLFSSQISTLAFGNKPLTWFIIFGIFIAPISAINVLISSVLNGLQHYKKLMISGAVSVPIALICTIYLIVKYGTDGALYSVLATSIVTSIVMIASAFIFSSKWLRLKYWFGAVKSKEIKAVGGYVLMALTSAICLPVSLMMVRNILVSHVGWNMAGQWQAVYKISEMYLTIITMALSTFYFPRLSALKNKDEIRREVFLVFKITMPIVIILASLVYFCRNLIIQIAFSYEFKAASDLFFVQLIGDVLKIASWLIAFPMLTRGAVKWFVSSEIIFSGLFVVLSQLMVSQFGAQGINMAYAMNYALYLIFVYSNLNKFST
ncbi:O-antigen translocase [Chromobacterium amazonense]|uniref:O-antigen translocase n=1 Tax=Chromobacterium amazonense TaxID=1382803 RepID=UPI003F795F6F